MKVLTVPENKSGREHVIPLSAAAMEIMNELPVWPGNDYYLFSKGGKQPIGNFTHVKTQLDALAPIPHYRLHDLRVTAKSKMAALGVRTEVSELVLGHTLKGLEATYNKWSYAQEKRDALELLAREIV